MSRAWMSSKADHERGSCGEFTLASDAEDGRDPEDRSPTAKQWCQDF